MVIITTLIKYFTKKKTKNIYTQKLDQTKPKTNKQKAYGLKTKSNVDINPTKV